MAFAGILDIRESGEQLPEPKVCLIEQDSEVGAWSGCSPCRAIRGDQSRSCWFSAGLQTPEALWRVLLGSVKDFMNVRLESFDQRRARVLALLIPDASHKLNNSIAVISGMAELALHGSAADELDGNLNLVFEHSRIVAKQLSRISAFAQSIELEVASEDAGRAYLDAASLLVPILQVSEGEFEYDQVELTYPVVIDKRRLIQALVILACGPLLASDPIDFGSEARPKIDHLRLSIAYIDMRTSIEIRFPSNDAGRDKTTGELVDAMLRDFDASVTTQCVGGETVHLIMLKAIE